MAKNQSAKRTTPVDIAPPESEGVMAAWDGLYHAFGARNEGVDVTPDGLVIRGLTFDAQHNGEDIVRDVNKKNRRVPLFPTILWINGVEPEGFTTAQEMTQFQVQNFHGSVEDGATKTPKYVRDAFAALKSSIGLSNKRGPKTSTIKLKNLASLDASVLRNANVSPADLQRLVDIATEVIASQAPAEVTTAS